VRSLFLIKSVARFGQNFQWKINCRGVDLKFFLSTALHLLFSKRRNPVSLDFVVKASQFAHFPFAHAMAEIPQCSEALFENMLSYVNVLFIHKEIF
jgi:hypothetical protein